VEILYEVDQKLEGPLFFYLAHPGVRENAFEVLDLADDAASGLAEPRGVPGF